MSELSVQKLASYVSVSEEVLLEAAELRAAIERWYNASPDQRDQWVREAQQRRADARAAVEPAELTLETLLAKLGWSQEYAAHLVQPYCDCSDGPDGWDACMHARDLGLWP